MLRLVKLLLNSLRDLVELKKTIYAFEFILIINSFLLTVLQ